MKILLNLQRITLCLMVMLMNSNVWAALPKPPDSDMASSSKGWIDVGGEQINKTLKVATVAMGVMLLVGVVAGIIRAYHVSQERGDLGHLFKMLIVGLLVAGVGMGLVYAAYQILPA